MSFYSITKRDISPRLGLLFGFIVLLTGCDTLEVLPEPEEPQATQVNLRMQACGATYEVKWGDTLGEIAQRCGLKQATLAKRNDIAPPYKIYKGQLLDIYPTGVASTTTTVISRTPKTTRTVKHQAPKTLPTSRWGWPVKSDATWSYETGTHKKRHLNIRGALGEVIYAVDDGEVVYTSRQLPAYGLMVVVRHDDQYISVYAHLDAAHVEEGQRVSKGQHIGDMGRSGATDDVKLMLEARYQGRVVDIQPLFSAE